MVRKSRPRSGTSYGDGGDEGVLLDSGADAVEDMRGRDEELSVRGDAVRHNLSELLRKLGKVHIPKQVLSKPWFESGQERSWRVYWTV